MTLKMSKLFDGLTPDLSALGATANGRILIILGVVWGIALLACVVMLMFTGARLSAAKKSKNPGAVEDAKGGVQWSLGGLLFCVMVPIIYGAILLLGGL